MKQLRLLMLLACCWGHQAYASSSFQSSSHLDSILREAIDDSQYDEFDVSLLRYQHILEEAKSAKDFRNQIRATINIGLLYLNYNSDEDALHYLLQSLDLTKQYGIDELLNSIYNNIGIVYSSNRDFDEAEKYFSEALQLSRQREEPEKVAINLINLGVLKSEQQAIDEANDYYQQALRMFQDLGDTTNTAMVLNNIGSNLYDEGVYAEAEEYFQQALSLANKDLARFYRPSFQLNYAKTAYQFQEYDSALVYLQHALDTILMVRDIERIIEANHWLAKTFDQKNAHDIAQQYYEESLNWKDSLLNEKNQVWVSEMQMRYEFGKQEKEIEFLQEKARQTKMIWGGIFLAVAIVSSLLFYSLRAKNTNLKQRNIILQKEQEVTNLEMARSQLQQEKLTQKLEAKNRELASKALHLLNKNEILTDVTTLLDQIDVQHQTANANLVRNAKRTITRNINLDEQWKDFKIHFEKVHAGFFTRLVEEFPNLSQTDLRLCAYLLINLDSKEIAQIANISPDSVRKRKQRLREKLNLTKDQDIRLLLTQYEMAQ